MIWRRPLQLRVVVAAGETMLVSDVLGQKILDEQQTLHPSTLMARTTTLDIMATNPR
jgi:hypothetical protein